MTDADRLNASGAITYAALYWAGVLLAGVFWLNRLAVVLALFGVGAGFVAHVLALKKGRSVAADLCCASANALSVAAAIALVVG